MRELSRVELGAYRDRVANEKTLQPSGRVLVLLSRVFNWGVDEGLIEFNPVARLRKPRPGVRDRVLSQSNIAVFWNVLSKMDITIDEPGESLLSTRTLDHPAGIRFRLVSM